MTIHDPDLQSVEPLAPPTESEAGGLLTIDLAAIEANWKKLAGMTLPVECAAVVKADALLVDDSDWGNTLYRAKPVKLKPLKVTAIPYYAWDHREPGEMRVWIRAI